MSERVGEERLQEIVRVPIRAVYPSECERMARELLELREKVEKLDGALDRGAEENGRLRAALRVAMEDDRENAPFIQDVADGKAIVHADGSYDYKEAPDA